MTPFRGDPREYPATALRLYVEALGGVVQPVQSGTCSIGVIGTLPDIPNSFHREALSDVPFVSVVAKNHALAGLRKVVSSTELAKHVQLVLTDRTPVTEGQNFGVLSPLTWRLADMGAKHAFLRAGFGFGHMPLWMVEDDLTSGRLVKIRIQGFPASAQLLAMQAVYRKDAPPGPAGRSFTEYLKHTGRK